MNHRTTLFVYSNEKAVFDALGAKETIVVPASKTSPLAREDRIEIDVSLLKPEYRDILAKLQLLNVQLGRKRNEKPQFTIFSDHESQPAGVRIDVAPQTARNMAQYEKLSQLAVDMVLRLIRVNLNTAPYFFEEWYRAYLFEEPDLEVSALRMWNTLVGEAFPITSAELQQATSMELILDGDKLRFLFYWPLIDHRLEFARDKREIGVFYLDSLPGDYDLSISGARVRGNSKFVPTSLYVNSFHTQLPGVSAEHAFVEPTGLHPKYKVSVSGKNEAPKSTCRLIFDLDIPSTYIVDRYQLAWFDDIFRNVSVFGHSNLELPSYKVSEGCSLRVELDPDVREFEIPLHLRYGEPLRRVKPTGLGAGDLYWDCDSDPETDSLIRGSFMHENRILERTHWQMFHIGSQGPNYLEAMLPVGDVGDSRVVEAGTLALVSVCAVWLAKIFWQI
ncbi:hypothetical protein KL936_004282 [Ogataea polymorpha]|nr:hypothetical protein KL936_004282 [Ogataea polymorpha]